MARFKTNDVREAVYFFYLPLMILGKISATELSNLVNIPAATLRSHFYKWQNKYGGPEAAKQKAETVISENQKAFDEFSKQIRSIKQKQLLPMLYGLYHGYEAAWRKYYNYPPGKWTEEFKAKTGWSPEGLFPYCGVVGLAAQEKRSDNLAIVYPLA